MKNNFKHIIALFLVIVMSFQMAAFVAADETAVTEEVVEEETYVPQNLREFQILNAIGVFTIYEEEDFTGNGELTRAEAAAVAARMTGLVDGSLTEGKVMPYTDVKIGDTYDYEIYHISNLGIMGGYNGEFNPDGAITEEQFVKVVVEALGYGAEAQSMGGYPYGYTITAGKYHILDNVSLKGNVPLTQDVAVQIVYNCLGVEMPRVTSVDGGYLTSVGDTIMNKYLDVYRGYGILKRNPNTYISIGEPSKQGVVQIGKEFYYAGLSNCDDYLGYNVEFFYKKADGDKLGTIVWASPWRNEATRLEADDISGYAKNQYTYYTASGREKTIKVPISADVIYNGVSRPVENFDSKNYVPTIGYVDLVDNDEDGEIDVVQIRSYDVYFIKANNTTEYVITAEDGKQIKEYDKAYWDVTGEDGEQLSAAKFVADTVFLLAVSLDGKVVRGFQITEQIEGTYESTYNVGNKQRAIINGVDYRIHSYCEDEFDKLKLSDYVGFYVYEDILLIKCIPASSLTESVGYLIEMATEPGLGGKVKVRMLLQTGEVQILDVNKKAKLILGNNTYNKPTDFKGLLTYSLDVYAGKEDIKAAAGTPVVSEAQPIIYKLNSAGEVILIEASTTHNYNEKVDIVSANDDNDGFNLVEMIRGAWIRVQPALRSIGDTKVLLDKEAFIIDIPLDLENYDAYKIYKFKEMSSWDTRESGNYTRPYRLYRSGNDILGANIMVGQAVRSSSNTSGTTFIVERIAESITDDGTKCYILSGTTTSLTSASVKTVNKAVVDDGYSTEDSSGNITATYNISIGDLISCAKDSYGLVDKIYMRYDRETSKVVSNSGEYLGSGTYSVGGQVYAIEGDSMAYYNGTIPEGGAVANDLRYLSIEGFKYVIFDPSLDRANSYLVGASLGEVKTYIKNGAAEVSSFLATKNSATPGIFVIYKK